MGRLSPHSKSSYIPSKDTRILREFTRYRSKLVSMRSSEKNRFQNAFTVCRSFKGILRILTIVLLSLMRSLAISLPNTKGKALCSVRFPVSNAERQLPMPEDLKRKQALSSAKGAVKLLVSLGLVTAGSISLDSLAG